jgi:hypothetical protein
MGSKDNVRIRVSDAERDQAISMLSEHMSTGRLKLDEFETRTGLITAARTRGELEEVFTDLPSPHPDLSAATSVRRSNSLVVRPKQAHPAVRVVANVGMTLAVPAAIVLTILFGMWWLFIPVGMLITGRWRWW